MLQSLLNSTTVPLLEKVAAFGERRHEVLAGNLANIDTPGYKTRDLSLESFQEALQQAVERRRQPAGDPLGSLNSPGSGIPSPPTQSSQIDDLFPAKLFQAVEAPPANITFNDAGNRSVEHEAMELNKNAMMQKLAVEMMAAQMAMLQAVISERA